MKSGELKHSIHILTPIRLGNIIPNGNAAVYDMKQKIKGKFQRTPLNFHSF